MPGAAPVEKSIKKLLVAVNEGTQFVGQCKYHMKVRRVNNFRPAGIHPDFFLNSLTVWAAAVAAGIIVEFHVAAAVAAAHVTAEGAGFTVQDGMCRFALYLRQIRCFCGISQIRSFKYLTDLPKSVSTVLHRASRPAADRAFIRRHCVAQQAYS